MNGRCSENLQRVAAPSVLATHHIYAIGEKLLRVTVPLLCWHGEAR